MSKHCQTEFAQQRKKLLEESLLNLMEEKAYPEITVKDICREAAIPRRTFYHYFESKEDVRDAIIESVMLQCFLENITDFQLTREGMAHCFYRVFLFWQGENRRKLDILLKNGMETQLMTFSIQWIIREWTGTQQNVQLSPKLLEIGLMVGVSNFFSLLFYWSRNGYQETAEQMADYAVWVLPQAFYNL